MLFPGMTEPAAAPEQTAKTEVVWSMPRRVPGGFPCGGSMMSLSAEAAPPGVSAALRAARLGAKTVLIEQNGCLGGMWTAGLLGWIIDHRKPESSLLSELKTELAKRGPRDLLPVPGRSHLSRSR